jgi:hypothetical protein
MTDTFLSKLSTARGAERSRVWLEGKRLSAHGFDHGAAYTSRWHRGALLLELGATTSDAWDNVARRVAGTPTRPIIDIAYIAVWRHGVLTLHVVKDGDRHVAGTPTRPIIDITGEAIRDAFGANAYVKVTYTTLTPRTDSCRP